MNGKTVTLLAGLLVLASDATAQRSPCPPMSDTRIRAILAWHEAGVDGFSDLRAIHAVLVQMSRDTGLSYAEVACRHSGRALRAETTRTYISHVTEDCSEPEDWPDYVLRCSCPDENPDCSDSERVCGMEPHPPWVPIWERRCQRLMEEAARVAAEPLVCTGARTWGNANDLARRELLSSDRGWQEVDCSSGDEETLNDYGFWARL